MKETGVWRYENRLIAVLCLMFGFVFFDRNAMAYLGPFVQKDLGLTTPSSVRSPRRCPSPGHSRVW